MAWIGLNELPVLIKDTVMQIEKAPINNHLRVLKISWKSRSRTSYNFEVIYP